MPHSDTIMERNVVMFFHFSVVIIVAFLTNHISDTDVIIRIMMWYLATKLLSLGLYF